MQKIVAPSLALSAQNNSSDTIFYNIVGNFVPPEWRGLTSHTGKALSKTAIQILSLLVSRTPTEAEKAASLERNGISTPNELQETYYYFEKLLGLCQRRIRQCMVELEKSGYIKLTLINMTKQYIKGPLKAQGLNDDTTWSKVKRYLLEKYGVHLYRSWFSNLTVVEENNETNQIILKPTTNFIGDWISSKYGQDLQMAFRNLNFSYEILRLKPQEI
ncbi:MAG: DnaA N-terminal domain-containing protein [Rickettsia endosymbiont of Pentastiridius leporinus]